MKPYHYLPLLFLVQFTFAQTTKPTTNKPVPKPIPKANINYRDISVDTLSLNDYFIISGNGGTFLNETPDVLAKKTVGFYYNNFERLLNGKTGEIVGYFPERIQGEYTNAMISKLYRIKSYMVFLGNNQISVYSTTGKFLYDFKTNIKIGEYSSYEMVFNEDFSQFAIIKDGDVFISNFDIKTGKYTDPKQISFTGNFLNNSVRQIQVWKGNIILYNSLRLNTTNGEVTPSNMFPPISSSEYITKEHEKNMFYFHSYKNIGDDQNGNYSGGIYKYDILQNNYGKLYEYTNRSSPWYYVNRYNNDVTLITSDEKINDQYYTQVALIQNGKTLNSYKLPFNEFFFTSFSPDLKKAISKNKQVLDIQTGEMQNFTNPTFISAGFNWLDNNRFIFSIEEDIHYKTYPITEVGTFLYDYSTKKAFKIFSYVVNNGSLGISTETTNNLVYIIANGFCWKYNSKTGEKVKMNSDRDVSIFSLKIYKAF